jgi:hypothetical protein
MTRSAGPSILSMLTNTLVTAATATSCDRNIVLPQGPPLSENLRRLLTGQPLQPFVPQSTFLSLISAGGRHAVGTKGWAAFEGGWAWQLKDYIDRSFMAKYGSDLPFENMQVGWLVCLCV